MKSFQNATTTVMSVFLQLSQHLQLQMNHMLKKSTVGWRGSGMLYDGRGRPDANTSIATSTVNIRSNNIPSSICTCWSAFTEAQVTNYINHYRIAHGRYDGFNSFEMQSFQADSEPLFQCCLC